MFRFMRRLSPEMQVVVTILTVLFLCIVLVVCALFLFLAFGPEYRPVGSCPYFPDCTEQ